MMRTVSCCLAAAAALGVASAQAQAPAGGDDLLRLRNIIQHMARTPFAPRYVPPGFSSEPLRLRRSGPDAPVQIVEANLTPRSHIAFQILSRPMAGQLLNELGGAPMMDRAYTATPMATFEINAVGRQRPFVVKCWSGQSAAGAKPEEDVCAAAVDPEVILVTSVQADPGGGMTAGSVATLRVRALASEGVSYWTAIDDQMENEFLGKLVR